MAKDVIIRGVTYQGVEKLSLPVSGGSALYRDTSDGDAVAGEIITGKKAYNANGAVNGNMVNQGAVSGAISDKDTPYTIPAGYHNGSGTVDIASAQKALLLPGNIRDGVTILGVTGTYSGGGGGPTASDAILTVIVPTGSNVTATKGGVTLLPTIWTTAQDVSKDCALFIIPSSLFDSQNSWTVTASLSGDTATETVTIDSNKQYDMELAYVTWLYKAGNTYDSLTGGWALAAASGSATYANNTTDGQMEVVVADVSSFQCYLHTVSKVDVTNYSKLYCRVKNITNKEMRLCITSVNSRDASIVAGTLIQNASDFTEFNLDVSTYVGSYYIGFRNQARAATWCVNAVWLEE